MPHWKRNLALLWVSQLFVMVGFASTMPFIPLFISDHLGISDPGPRGAVVASFSFAATLGYGIFNPLWGALSDRVGVKPMLLRGTFLAGLVFPLMAWSSSSWELVAIRFVSAALAGTTAASQILIVKGTPEERQGFALGFLGAPAPRARVHRRDAPRPDPLRRHLAFCASRTALYLVGGGLGAVMQKMLSHLTAPEDRGTVFGVQSTAHSLGIMLSTTASGALIYRLGAAPATADWGVRGTFLGAAALSLLFVPACWALVRRATRRAP